MTEQVHRIELPEVRLEGRLATAPQRDPAQEAPAPLAVIAHPMPTMGGSMDNNVVWALRDGACGAGLSALRFNFRGVGASSGHLAGDRRDASDLAALLSAVSAWPEAAGGLVGAGYSFGAWAWCRALAAEDGPSPDGPGPARPPTSSAHPAWPLRALVLVAPPVALLDFSEALAPRALPVLVISGTRDSFGPPAALASWLDGWQRAGARVDHLPLDGADHFFGGFETEIRARVTRWLQDLPSGPGLEA